MSARCPSCGGPTPPELSMRAKNGQTLTMISCPRCEARAWFADGEPVQRDDVLRLTAGDAGFVMTPSTRRPPVRR